MLPVVFAEIVTVAVVCKRTLVLQDRIVVGVPKIVLDVDLYVMVKKVVLSRPLWSPWTTVERVVVIVPSRS